MSSTQCGRKDAYKSYKKQQEQTANNLKQHQSSVAEAVGGLVTLALTCGGVYVLINAVLANLQHIH